MKTLALAVLPALAAALAAQETFPASAQLDQIVQQAIQEDQIPGAVLLIGRDGTVLHRKAYGRRSLESAEPMTVDTIFDAASLTKVVATTPAVMKLFEQGRVRLNDPVTSYLPEFQGGKSGITVRHLLTHFSGLRPDLDLEPAWSGYETGIQKALIDKPAGPPGVRFVYSDINFILLGEIVRRVSGKPLPDYVRETVFEPLGMRESMFNPPPALRERIAPTELLAGEKESLRGVVHDETTRYMGGVAGHAGLFTTAGDLARFAEMMIRLGERNGARVFNPLTVRKFTTPESPADQPILRGGGWDIDSPYSSNRGELFPAGSFGHTGFTGTSLWIDPVSRSYVILLANSVHPRRRPPITSLRGRVATAAAAGLGIDLPGVSLTGYNETMAGAGLRRTVNRNAQTLTGLDVLAGQKFAAFAGKRVGLITNHTGLDRAGRRNIEVMLEAGVQLTALFSPEHGLSGREDRADIGHGKDDKSGLPIFSLHQGQERKPSDAMLKRVDLLVFDIQDVGARYYTYMCTMRNAMVEAGRLKLPFWVLDRPNPITGTHVEGPMLDRELHSFVGCVDLPLRHGMTLGEIARMIAAEEKPGLDLHVVAMKGWQRGDWFDTAGLIWTNPSPNIRSLNAALLYPGIAMLEYSRNYSVGRGTDAPFEQVGADWIKGPALAAYLNSRYIPGVRVYPTRLRPSSSNFAGQEIEGIRFVITDREAFNAVRLGIEVAAALEKLYPGKIAWDANARLIGNRWLLDALRTGQEARSLATRMEADLAAFLERAAPYRLYHYDPRRNGG
ncbi:MAG: DUF1343 domain-containing protein [Acidobacteria bacterium]|nr:DUF1343 domain-containing protein [Acidobacteriota bacterium]